MSEYANRNVLWAETLVDELVAGGLDAVCISPGSRSTPLTIAFAECDDVDVFSVLDERSAAYFALGRGRRTGEPTALVCTSGTAAANYHPAIVEASQARVPLLALTADRPPELRDSGANQTVDQEKLYGAQSGGIVTFRSRRRRRGSSGVSGRTRRERSRKRTGRPPVRCT